MTTKGRNNLCGEEGGDWEGGKGGRGEGRRYIMVFQDNSLPMNCQRRGRGGGGGGSHKNISEPYACWGRGGGGNQVSVSVTQLKSLAYKPMT